ncbi:MAG: hypothetical protein PVG99_11345 [Desulfobacteraceae bacterium]|jgi:hypothetical protein
MMATLFLRKSQRLCALGLASLWLLCGACYLKKGEAPEKKTFLPKIESMVVFGFRPSISRAEKAGAVRSPLSGAVFMAEPVPEQVARNLTTDLFDRLVQTGRYQLISPSQAKGVFSRLLSSEAVMGDIEMFQKIGQAFSSDATLTGHVYRWREREGTDYAVNLPASVAFDLYLISSDDGAIIWKGRFDKTQQSLTENLFDFGTFLKGKGKWMRAEELAAMGLAGLVEKLPAGKREGKD